jgi:hypothetical protein
MSRSMLDEATWPARALTHHERWQSGYNSFRMVAGVDDQHASMQTTGIKQLIVWSFTALSRREAP